MTDILDAALAWHAAGTCVLPAATDGSKRPAIDWKTYQQARPDTDTITNWFAAGHAGLGVVCGAVSGNLEMLELEGRAVTEGAIPALVAAAAAAGLTTLWAKIVGGYAEHTPSGGLHLLYRIHGANVPGNTKLARRPATDSELAANPTDKIKVLAETRGEGGWTVVAPSNGTTHATGRPWTTIAGTPATIPTITAGEREQLVRLIRLLDQIPAPDPAPTDPPRPHNPAEGVSPGDDYETRTPWADIIGPHGWTPVARHGPRTSWRRPGKDSPGISATTGGAADGRDRLYVFTSASVFEPERPYTKFGAYALLEHAGDHSAAAKQLRRAGYGTPAPISPDPYTAQQAAIRDLLPAEQDPTGTTSAPDAPPAHKFGATEDGLALALIAHHGTNLRFCPQREAWLRWDGHRWAWDTGERHREHIRDLARTLPDEPDSGFRTFKRRALSAAGVTGVARLAQSDQRVTVPFGALDADPWALNTPHGVVDLRTGKMAPPNPDHLHTRTTLCAPNPAADQTVWTRFLADTFDHNQDLITYLQRLIGYSAIGYVGPHVLPFCHGSGGNGKSVFLEAVAGVLGDYATTAPVGFLMAQQHTGHETEIARLAGARMVLCSEVNETDQFDEAKVKQLTGGDTLTARFMRQDHFSFTPTHHLWLVGNHKPAVRSGGRSFWRRLRLIPFLHEVPEDQVVEDLQGMLIRDHGPAILAWITQGAADYHHGGLREPQAVKAATAEYAKDQDTVAQFIEERCHLGGGTAVQIKTSVVREAYEAWCYAQGERPVTAKAFGLALKNRFGVDLSRTKTARMYVGLGLLSTDEDDDGESGGDPR